MSGVVGRLGGMGVGAAVDAALDVVDPALLVGGGAAEKDEGPARSVQAELHVGHFVGAVGDVRNLEGGLEGDVNFQPELLGPLAFGDQKHIVEQKEVFELGTSLFGVVIQNFTFALKREKKKLNHFQISLREKKRKRKKEKEEKRKERKKRGEKERKEKKKKKRKERERNLPKKTSSRCCQSFWLWIKHLEDPDNFGISTTV